MARITHPFTIYPMIVSDENPKQLLHDPKAHRKCEAKTKEDAILIAKVLFSEQPDVIACRITFMPFKTKGVIDKWFEERPDISQDHKDDIASGNWRAILRLG